jgi:hypothetical protein
MVDVNVANCHEHTAPWAFIKLIPSAVTKKIMIGRLRETLHSTS